MFILTAEDCLRVIVAIAFGAAAFALASDGWQRAPFVLTVIAVPAALAWPRTRYTPPSAARAGLPRIAVHRSTAGGQRDCKPLVVTVAEPLHRCPAMGRTCRGTAKKPARRGSRWPKSSPERCIRGRFNPASMIAWQSASLIVGVSRSGILVTPHQLRRM